MTPRLRRGDCGHLVPAEMAPNVTIEDPFHGDREGYACDECLGRARQRQVETKVVELAATAEGVERKPFQFAPGSSAAFRDGARAALEGRPESALPYPDRRAKDARDWVKGWREGKSDGKQTGGA